MLRSMWIVMAVVVLGLAGVATAQATRPADATTRPAGALSVATMPATSQATTAPAAPVVAKTPQEALKKLVTALEQGDGPTIQGLLVMQNDQERRLADAMVEWSQAVARLKQAALKAWGPEGARPLIGDNDPSKALALIDAAEVQTQQTIAIISMAGRPAAFLQQVGGNWRVPLSAVTQDITPENIELRTQEIGHQAKLYNDTAGEIAAGKFKDAMGAAEGLRTRINSLTSQPSTTQATTQGATQPAP